MIGFLRWLHRGYDHSDTSDLDALRDEAEAEQIEARKIRRRAEEVGPVLRRRVAENHITEGFAAAFERQRHA